METGRLRVVTPEQLETKLEDLKEEQSATFVARWAPNTAYALGAKVLNPTGDIVSAVAAFTSGAAYVPANWSATVDARIAAAVGGVSGGGASIRLDALAAGKRLRATLVGNDTETAKGVTLGAVTASTAATPLLTLGVATFTDAGDIVSVPTAHGLVTGDVVTFGTITTTTGVIAGDPIFVRDVPTSTTFTLTTSPGGSVRALVGDGSAIATYRHERAFDRQGARVSPALRVTETRPVQPAATYPRWEFIAADPAIITFAPGTGTYTAMRVEVEYSGTALGIRLRNTAGLRGRVYVDGRYLTAFSVASLTAAGVAASGVGRIPLTFDSSRRRTITLEFDGVSEFAGFDIQPSFPLIYPTGGAKGPRVLIEGDSFTEGEGAGTSEPYTRRLSHLMGWRDVWKAGSGGTGYVSASSALRPALIDRYQNDIIAQSPDVCIIAMGINDRAAYEANPTSLLTAATTIWDAVITALPATELIIIGPWPNTGGTAVSAGLVSMDLALAALAKPRSVRYISPISEGWKFTLADATHPDPAGHEYIAWRLAGHLSVPYIAPA